MIDEKEISYPQPMLVDVDYQQFDEDFEPLIDLEHGVLEHCQAFLEKLEHALLDAKMVQVPELITTHLCCYLGTVTTVYTANKAKQLEPAIIDLLEQHADFAFSKFNQYPINSSVATHHEKQTNLSQLREDSPGSIVAQTIRLGRIIIDMMERLGDNPKRPLRNSEQKQEELLCPEKEFFAFLIPLVNQHHHKWQEILDGKSINHAINQLTVQIAWLIGYFSHLSKQAPDSGHYLEYGLPCITLYREFTDEFLQAMHAKGQMLTSMQVDDEDEPNIDPKIESLLQEIQALSSKTHADLPPAITPFQKETAIVQAGIEKLLIELMTEGMATKVILMSVFYFWFTLDAPLQGINQEGLDDCTPFEEMDNIIQLVKSTTDSLPDPDLSPALKELNSKMQLLKSNLPDPESLDEVSKDIVSHHSNKVNTAIHTLTSDYLNQDIHPEVIANVLFSQWLRLSVFFGVSEKKWQKMDYYFTDIITTARDYLRTAFNSSNQAVEQEREKIDNNQIPDELLPPNVTMYRSIIREEMTVRYAFFHHKHGSLGQIYFKPMPDGKMFMHCEVAGSEGAPMTEKRKKLLMHLTELMPSQIDRLYGKGDGEPPAIMHSRANMIESKMMVCLTCNAPVALLIFAADTPTPSEGNAAAELEDYACLMHQKIADCDLPTWVIGDSDEIEDDIGCAWTLKIWPEREETKPIRSDEINRQLNILQTTHCKNIKA